MQGRNMKRKSLFAPVCFFSFWGPVYLLEWGSITCAQAALCRRGSRSGPRRLAQVLELKWLLLANGLLAVGLNGATVRLMHLAAPTVFALTGPAPGGPLSFLSVPRSRAREAR
jgi:hypothetical protein